MQFNVLTQFAVTHAMSPWIINMFLVIFEYINA